MEEPRAAAKPTENRKNLAPSPIAYHIEGGLCLISRYIAYVSHIKIPTPHQTLKSNPLNSQGIAILKIMDAVNERTRRSL